MLLLFLCSSFVYASFLSVLLVDGCSEHPSLLNDATPLMKLEKLLNMLSSVHCCLSKTSVNILCLSLPFCLVWKQNRRTQRFFYRVAIFRQNASLTGHITAPCIITYYYWEVLAELLNLMAGDWTDSTLAVLFCPTAVVASCGQIISWLIIPLTLT